MRSGPDPRTSDSLIRRPPFALLGVVATAAVAVIGLLPASMPNQERGAAVSVCAALRPWSRMWGEFRHLD